MAKPILVLVLGAGASQALGLPGTYEISNYIKALLRERDGYPVLSGVGPETQADIRSGFPPRLEPLIDSIRRAGTSNFEEDMNALESLMTLAPPSPIQDIMGRRRAKSPLSYFVRIKSVYEAFYHHETLMNLMNDIIDGVRTCLLERQAKLEKAKLSNVKVFLQALSAHFELRVYTFNFDTSIDSLVENPNDGFLKDGEIGRFSVSHFLNGGGTRFAHLHGCNDFRVSRLNQQRSEYAVVKTYGSVPEGLQWYAESFTQAGDFALIGSIITGLRKAEKTRTEPYGSYAFAVEDDLLRNPRVLLIGYGGADIYFDHQLLRARAMHNENWKCAILNSSVMQPGEKLFELTGALAGIETVDEAVRMTRSVASEGRGNVRHLHVDVTGWRPDDGEQTDSLIHYLRGSEAVTV